MLRPAKTGSFYSTSLINPPGWGGFAGFDVTTLSFRSEAFARGARMLRTALGPAIAGYLEDASIVEVMLNPDGRLWIDRLSGGLEDTGLRVDPADADPEAGEILAAWTAIARARLSKPDEAGPTH